MIEVVQEGGMWTAYRDGASMLYSQPRREKVVAYAKRKAGDGEEVKIRDTVGGGA